MTATTRRFRRGTADTDQLKKKEAHDAITRIHHRSNHDGRHRGARAAGSHVIAGHTEVLEDQEDVTSDDYHPRDLWTVRGSRGVATSVIPFQREWHRQ